MLCETLTSLIKLFQATSDLLLFLLGFQWCTLFVDYEKSNTDWLYQKTTYHL